MPEPKGNLVVMCGFRADGTLRAVLLGDDDSLGGGTTPHALLDGSIDSDTVAGSPVAGDLIVGTDQGGGVIKWQRFPKGSASQILHVKADGSTVEWTAPAAGADVLQVQVFS